MEAVAHGRSRMPFGFAPRFFIALALGFVWVRWLPLLLLWDAAVFVAWLWDFMRLPPPQKLRVSRTFSGPLELARPVNVVIVFQHLGPFPLRILAIDELSPALYSELPRFELALSPDGVRHEYTHEYTHQYTSIPRTRGDAALGSLYFRYRTLFALAERWAVAPLNETVCVLPDVAEANRQALYLIRSRQLEMQMRRRKQRGLGREFESLRDYRAGDEVRDICWSATARRHSLITRTFEAERTQTVWIVIDSGRLLRAKVEQPNQEFRLSKIDYSVNAALSLAQVASQHGDRVGAIAYGRKIQQSVGAGRGPEQLRRWIDALARVRAESSEASHGLAARTLLHRQTRRSLIVWITDFAETPTIPDVVEYAMQLARRHLVLFIAIGQPDVAAAARHIPETEFDMFRGAAALALTQRREVLLRSLRQQGALAMEVAPGKLTMSVVNEYLAIKDRAQL